MAASENLLNPLIKKRLELAMHARDIQNCNITITPSAIENPNMLGLIWDVRITGKDATNRDVEYNWILKSATLTEVVRKYAQVDRLFKKEIYLYSKLLPQFDDLRKESSFDRFSEIPAMHMNFTDTYQESLLLENMKTMGFSQINSSEPCSRGHATLAMKALGKFHALSYAFRQRCPEEYKKLTELAKNRFSVNANVEFHAKHQKICCERVLETLKTNKDRSIVTLFKKFMEKSLDYQTQAVKMGAMGPYAVLTHGDAILDNMLFKYGNPNKPTIPTEICLLDWQFCRFGSPALDISQFLFVATDKEFRAKYYVEMLRTYYYSLCSYLCELQCDPEKILPFDILMLQMKRFSVYGLCMAITTLHVIMNEEKVNNLSGNIKEADIGAIFEKSPTNGAYMTRIRDLVLDYQDYGYFEFLN